MYRKFVVAAVLTLVTFGSFAGVKVTNLDLRTDGPNGFLNVALDGRSNDLPDVKVFGNSIEITLNNALPFNAITKNVRGAILSANVLNGKAIIRATLPYAVNASAVDLGWKNSDIEVLFPRGVATTNINRAPTKEVTVAMETLAPAAVVPKAVKAPAPEKKTDAKPTFEPAAASSKLGAVKKEELNEDYLNKLMNEGKDTPKAVETKKDEIKLGAAAPERSGTKADVPKVATDTFSFAGYAAKFTIFLALVLGLFYGVVQVLKKGVFNKGKLGFLNNGKMIEVISTTYVAPKKSLMIVKAHKQLFLVANSETGLQFLAEMKDTTGIIKEGEKSITGTNFDLNMLNAEADSESSTITLKENIMESTPVREETALSKIAKATDVVKFSEELKKKARKLKPIEFN
ncbi:MAG: flagellar biosynthetic protein FliO [Bdellovibrionota bacterium]